MFKRTVGIGCVLLALLILGADQRSSSAGTSLLSVDNQPVGALAHVEGGTVIASVVVEGPGEESVRHKHLGNLRYEDITCVIPPGSIGSLQPRIDAAWKLNFARFNGAITTAEADGTTEMTFSNALLSEVTIPACDTGHNQPGFFTLKFTPEFTRSRKVSAPGAAAVAARGGRGWMSTNFELRIDGLDCTLVSRVDPLTVKLPMTPDNVGDLRDRAVEPTTIEFPNLRVTLAGRNAATWEQWFDEFVVQGKNDSSREKSGTLVLRHTDGSTLMAINFSNLGIFSLRPAAHEGGRDQRSQLVAELYCERMELSGQVKPTAPPAVAGAKSESPAAPANPPPPPATAAPAAAPAAVPTPTLSEKTRPAPKEGKVARLVANPKIAKGMGRLVVRYPDGTKRDNQRVQFRKDRDDKHAGAMSGSVAKELAPGEYVIAINSKLVEGVVVEAGHDAQVYVGAVRVTIKDGEQFDILEEDIDNAPTLTWERGPKDIALPPGDYFIRVGKQITPITIKDGKITEFTHADAAAEKRKG